MLLQPRLVAPGPFAPELRIAPPNEVDGRTSHRSGELGYLLTMLLKFRETVSIRGLPEEIQQECFALPVSVAEPERMFHELGGIQVRKRFGIRTEMPH